MKRIALMLTTVAILFVAANAAYAHGHHPGHRYGHFYGYRGPAVIQPRVLMRPQLYVPPPPPVWYSPVPRYRYYAPAPRYNFYYRGRGLSLGIGF